MLTCSVYKKKFTHVLQDDPKLKNNKSFCSEFCWSNNNNGQIENPLMQLKG